MFLGPQGLVFLDSKAWGLQYLFRDYVCASVCMHLCESVHVRVCVCVCECVDRHCQGNIRHGDKQWVRRH